MKIIISHDVDHLYPIDHIMHDLIIPKLWVRSLLHLLQGKIAFKTFICRLGYPFMRRYHRIEEVLEKDYSCGIPSTFFFGMETGLGMSYGWKKSIRYINYVKQKGFDVGVHGIEYQKKDGILAEYNRFASIVNEKNFGIRMHYVRYNDNTFSLLNSAGYLYDTSEFDKKGQIFKAPYKVENMWEFPLHIMDGYVIPVGDLEKGKQRTKQIIKLVQDEGLPYCTILFHDYLYNEKCYPNEKEWYDWLLNYIQEQGYTYISYDNAIKELNRNYE